MAATIGLASAVRLAGVRLLTGSVGLAGAVWRHAVLGNSSGATATVTTGAGHTASRHTARTDRIAVLDALAESVLLLIQLRQAAALVQAARNRPSAQAIVAVAAGGQTVARRAVAPEPVAPEPVAGMPVAGQATSRQAIRRSGAVLEAGVLTTARLHPEWLVTIRAAAR